MAIVVVGNVFVDIKGFPDDVYIPAGRNAGRVDTVHGGVGRNVVEDIANSGLEPVFVSMVDDNAEGGAVIDRLKSRGVNTDYIPRVPGGMGIWLAVFDHTGDIVASISRRPKMEAMARLLEEKGDEIFRDADSIVLEFDVDREVTDQVFFYAKKYSKPVYALVANMSIACQRKDQMRLCSCFVCNEQEAGILFERDFSALSPEDLCRQLPELVRAEGIPSMVVTMGGQGSVYADMEGKSACCPPVPVQVKDTTGAGDAFCAGLAIGLSYGKCVEKAMAIGSCLASSVIGQMENVCPCFSPAELGL